LSIAIGVINSTISVTLSPRIALITSDCHD